MRPLRLSGVSAGQYRHRPPAEHVRESGAVPLRAEQAQHVADRMHAVPLRTPLPRRMPETPLHAVEEQSRRTDQHPLRGADSLLQTFGALHAEDARTVGTGSAGSTGHTVGPPAHGADLTPRDTRNPTHIPLKENF